MTPIDPDLSLERALFDGGAALVAGMDEVGRGAWAGPVSVGVVVIRSDQTDFPVGVRDSKALSRRARERLVPLIEEWAHASGVGHASPAECDAFGMRAAIALAGQRALNVLAIEPDALIVDGPVDLLGSPDGASESLFAERSQSRPAVTALVKADQKCATVAAASVLAKVERDGLLASMAPSFPAFDLDSNVGYPSPVHRRALRGYGLTPIHRRSWSFVDDIAWLTGDPRS